MATKTSTAQQLNKFIEFRQSVYRHGPVRERDAQFELIDAILLRHPVVSGVEPVPGNPAALDECLHGG